ncbi:hypothetical protein [[Phormidium] sp. ETS-05]|uniref:hypothetical protein n=1 Tax=[Phormidium] sp. ETS-05 TaxID=222819 RepID=UPI0018EECEA9|nr:hypothetical protein [[Phormidium] sp. ETS-05]
MMSHFYNFLASSPALGEGLRVRANVSDYQCNYYMFTKTAPDRCWGGFINNFQKVSREPASTERR